MVSMAIKLKSFGSFLLEKCHCFPFQFQPSLFFSNFDNGYKTKSNDSLIFQKKKKIENPVCCLLDSFSTCFLIIWEIFFKGRPRGCHLKNRMKRGVCFDELPSIKMEIWFRKMFQCTPFFIPYNYYIKCIVRRWWIDLMFCLLPSGYFI